jgi:hypothetical protein
MAALLELETMRGAHAQLLKHHTCSQTHLQRTDLQASGLSEQLVRVQHDLVQTRHTLSVIEARDTRKRERIVELSRTLKASKARERRTVIRKATPLATKAPVYYLKQGGNRIRDEVRDAITKLSLEGLGSKRVWPVFQAMADLFGIDLRGSFGASSVRNVMNEGGWAAHLQLAQAMLDCKGARNSFCSMRDGLRLIIIQLPRSQAMVHRTSQSTTWLSILS